MRSCVVTMCRRLSRCLIGITLLAGAIVSARHATAQTAASDTGAPLAETLQPYLARFGLPAVGAVVLHDGKVVASGAIGTRRVGTDIAVTINDRFHIGSDTKAMTVLLAAQFIQEGKLRWDTRLEEVYPELATKMDPGFRAITLIQLMSHTSGLPSDNDEVVAVLERAMTQPGNLDAQRLWVVQQWAPKPLVGTPGVTWAYSNLGFTVLGAVLERAGGKTWEELVVARVFDPLGLRTAGFGPQSSMGKVDAPLGHLIIDGNPVAMLAGPNGDNPAVLGPAGTVHLSLMEFAAWANWQVGEGRRGPALVPAEVMRKMHTPIVEMPEQKDAATGTPGSIQATHLRYALGWGEATMSYAKEPLLFHGGSNGMNYAVIALQPQHDFAMVMMTNIAGPKVDDAFKGLGQELYQRFMTP
jgi:CubicO group peptidase (beta-lactamase class C family)